MPENEPGQGEKTKIEDLTADQIAEYEFYMKNLPPEPENKRESVPEILELEELINSCESKYPIQELMTIALKEDAIKSVPRSLLREELVTIFNKLRSLEKETDISPEKLEELKQKFKRLSNAVGIVNREGKVDHDRDV
jgi:hypothetical protein